MSGKSEQKHLADERGQKRILSGWFKLTGKLESQIMTYFTHGEQKNILECTKPVLAIGYTSSIPP